MLAPDEFVFRAPGYFDPVEGRGQDLFIELGKRRLPPLQKPQRESDRAFAVVPLQQGDESVQLLFSFVSHSVLLSYALIASLWSCGPQASSVRAARGSKK